MASKLIIVVGSGPGIGVSTASLFASKGFNVALLSRNAQRLKDDATKVKKAATGSTAIQVQTYAVDVAESSVLKQTLDLVNQDMGAPEVVLYNAAKVAESKIGEESPESVIEDFKVINIGCYVTATWALPLLESVAKNDKSAHPSFLITGGGLWKYPLPTHFSLSMQKAAQINFAGSLTYTAAPKGIHIASVDVGGVVQDSDPVINAKNIATQFWELSQEDKKDWRSVVNVGDFRESFKDVLDPKIALK